MSNPLRKRLAVLAASFALAAGTSIAAPSAKTKPIPIRHVIIIMQENRSFDSYFGTFPGADGIPAGTCLPIDIRNPENGCVTPFHDPHDVNAGGPHRALNAQEDIRDGITTTKMNGFVYQQAHSNTSCPPDAPNCSGTSDGVERHDVAGYHTKDEIPNYWSYASKFVLQDRLFEPVRSWSWPAHVEMTSEWVAVCQDNTKASTCVTDPNAGANGPHDGFQMPWANLFQLFDRHGVSWKYYLDGGAAPDCEDEEITCSEQAQLNGVPSIWNPAPYFVSVKRQGPAYLAKHNPATAQFFTDIQNGTLPQVSWIVPNNVNSEHPPASVNRGMNYVTRLVNAVMGSHYWKDTVIFLAWDDWGGFYDHVVPPNVDRNPTFTPIEGYGLRVPGITISAYAKAGMIDHSVLSFDAYATFIEDLFMNKTRLDPKALGNPDSRPDIRDALTKVHFLDGTTAPVGNLMNEFDFSQKPLPPLKLSAFVPSGITTICGATSTQHCTKSTVTILWDSVAASGYTYHVERDGKDLPQCVGTATLCTDTPGRGPHFYRAYSISSKGEISPRSAAAEADEP
ncbi:MAG TPA: alkaline phosphatase family protein [Alphaproteobacteria bacterium]|jgi:phospholipase C|nr:alkaline phosphatase family protein [Alphaproteobacteria bacterium]